jgi:hypothetical protein
MRRKPHRDRAQAANRKVNIVGPGHLAKIAMRVSERRPHRLAACNRSKHRVGMSHDVLGCGLYRDVDPMLERFEVKRRRPRVIHHYDQPARMRDARDRGHVLNLEQSARRRLDVHDFGVGTDHPGDIRADQRIVIGGVDAELF